MADDEGLKVILIPGGGKYLLNNDTSPLSGVTSGSGSTQDKNAADYAAILSVYTNYFRNDTAILAYDLWNEPGGWYNPMYYHTKQELCEWSKLWFDAIKSPTNDPNHLVTIGLFSFEDSWQWDVGVMKMDFLSAHIYPYLSGADGNDPTKALYRWTDHVAWLQKNCPIPWIIGETSCGSVASGYYGTSEPNQAYFADYTLKAVRNAGGSGYSWWSFADGDDSGNLGLIKQFEDPNSSGNYSANAERQAASSVFYNYLTPSSTGIPPLVASFSGPSPVYYNPFSHPAAGTYTVTGNVSDQNGPIPDAVVTGNSPIGTNINGIYWVQHYTFTDANGDFNLIPYDYDPSPPINPLVNILQISAVGTDRIERGNNNTHTDAGTNTNPTLIGICSGSGCSNNFVLTRNLNFQNDVFVNNVTVNSGTQNFPGGNTLTTLNTVTVQSGAVSDFTAREEIHVNSGFHAENGSETHIFIAETFPDCPAFSSYRNTSASTDNGDSNNGNSEIELKFLPAKNQFGFSVYPNPGKDIFNIEIIDNETINPQYQVKIMDLIGRFVYTSAQSVPLFSLNLSSLSKGIYYIQINSKIQKLIIQ